jgi:hypothetical protein
MSSFSAHQQIFLADVQMKKKERRKERKKEERKKNGRKQRK